ncbi:MAG: hypothetical protein PHN49_00310 [Candidatus Omnitrophica bacterium]|nr:hypothetical protein [Candidatus Omnitrophota bacterium]
MTIIRVTFDSNVWRKVASPTNFPKEKNIAIYKNINLLIKNNRILPCLPETIFTLEAIKRTDRRTWLESYLNSKPNAHPGNTPQLSSHLQDALKLGFKLLRQPRNAGAKNPAMLEESFLSDTEISQSERQKLFFESLEQIELIGCGMHHIKNIGKEYSHGKQWLQGIKNAPANREDDIIKAIAEWADGDSVAAHIAYKNKYFCTEDKGRNEKITSVLSKTGKELFASKYGIIFVTPTELNELFKN